jgi:hypothetical protein
MRSCKTKMRQEFTLATALSDPLVRTVMAADGVDPQELSAMLSEIGLTLDHTGLQPRRSALSAMCCC